MDATNKTINTLSKEAEVCNYNLITDMAAKLSMLKGYQAAYSNPKKRKDDCK